MYREHPDIQTPSDNKNIWRYMNLPKFLDLINSNELHFSRLGVMNDKFEGAMSTPTIEELQALLPPANRDVPPGATPFSEGSYLLMRISTFINCWHLNTNESAAMWSQYAGEGIAIKSTVQRMKESLDLTDDEVHIGQTKYINFSTRRMDPQTAMSSIFHKRLSFRHEQELRAVMLRFPQCPDGMELPWDSMRDDRNWPSGVRTRVDVERLIQRVHVSPGRPEWFRELVHDLVHRFNHRMPVESSRIDKRPKFF